MREFNQLYYYLYGGSIKIDFIKYYIQYYNHINTIIMSSTINKVTLDALIVRVNELEQQISLLLSAKAVDVSDKKKEKKEKKEKKVADPDKPKKKRTSGYILYSNASRDDVKDSLGGEEGEKPKNTDIMNKSKESILNTYRKF